MTRTCSKCGLKKDDEHFYDHGSRPGRKHPWCKDCFKIGATNRQNRYRYGLEPNEVFDLFEKAGWCCQICGTSEGKLCIDHKGDKVRGVLCDRCNLGLGKFRDDPILLLKAIRYL